MGLKPPNSDILTVYTYWDSPRGFICPLCDHPLEFAYNDGGRIVVTTEGTLWVVSNYYRCTYLPCDLHSAFPMVFDQVIQKKKFGKDVWERVVRFHFKYHLDFALIQKMLWDEWAVAISKNSIRNICQYFEKAGELHLNEHIQADLSKNGYIILSLDGAQPTKGEPALWLFTDRITGHVLLAELLDTASASLLCERMHKIEQQYGVPIKAVISDKQKNIVNAVREFNPSIPHAYCQYHFLNHIMDPILTKDSHIATNLRKEVRKLSILQNQAKGFLSPSNPEYNALYQILSPLADECRSAIAVHGRKWDILPGVEMYKNLQYVSERVKTILDTLDPNPYCNSLMTLYDRLLVILAANTTLFNEIQTLLSDAIDLRQILAREQHRGQFIKDQVKTWAYRIETRLKRRQLEYHPEFIKNRTCTNDTPIEQIWQEWIRLVASYLPGLFYTYDSDSIEPTNNAIERLINRTKRHFKKWLGQQDISATFQNHGAKYALLSEFELGNTQITEILWEHSVGFVEGIDCTAEYLTATMERDWRIRDRPTGNWEQLIANVTHANLQKCD